MALCLNGDMPCDPPRRHGTLALCIYTTCTAPPVCGMESVGRGVSLGWKKEVDRDGRGKEKRERRGGG